MKWTIPTQLAALLFCAAVATGCGTVIGGAGALQRREHKGKPNESYRV